MPSHTRLQFQWDPAGLAPESTQGVFSHVLDTHYGSGSINYKGAHYHFDWEVRSDTISTPIQS